MNFCKWKNRVTRIVSLFLTMVFVVGALAIPAYASTTSATTSKTVYGTTYTYYSSLGISSYDEFMIGVDVEVNKTVAEGYIGAKPRLYTSDGTLAKTTDWMYNSFSVEDEMGFTLVYVPDEGGYYYSKGQIQFYNGNGYTTYTCNATPNVSGWSRTNIEVTRNKNGEIYGSEMLLEQIGVKPDLIKAVGQDGTIGYVKATELDNSSVNCPEAALVYVNNMPQQRVIPLYAEDGETILGEYVIDNTCIHTEIN